MMKTLRILCLGLGGLGVAVGLCVTLPGGVIVPAGWAGSVAASDGSPAFMLGDGASQEKPGSPGGTPGVAPAASASRNRRKTKGPAIHHVVGRIVSISDDSLVVSHGRGKTKEESTFIINSETTKKGEPASGDRAGVSYRIEGREKVVTHVAVLPKAKPGAKAKGKPPA
jgi:hypothetical protein